MSEEKNCYNCVYLDSLGDGYPFCGATADSLEVDSDDNIVTPNDCKDFEEYKPHQKVVPDPLFDDMIKKYMETDEYKEWENKPVIDRIIKSTDIYPIIWTKKTDVHDKNAEEKFLTIKQLHDCLEALIIKGYGDYIFKVTYESGAYTPTDGVEEIKEEEKTVFFSGCET